MSCTRALASRVFRSGAVLLVLVAVAAVVFSDVAYARATIEGPVNAAAESPEAQQEVEDPDPEANLPSLFAAFFVTWAAFFGYVFVMSRRQREMRREIDALKLALAERERQELKAEREPEEQG